jgi:hypothetical protein
MSKRRAGRSRGPEGAPSTISILPMQLQVGDRYSDETGEWEVVSRPVSLRGGKGVRARVHSHEK